jgi:Protein of unknown function (DUF3037)
MPANNLFEYAVVRVVPRVEREEFLNIGIILYSKTSKFLQVRYHLDTERLQLLHPLLDFTELRLHLMSMEKICLGAMDGGPIARLEIASRFRWLTATRSTVLQSSKVHPGICEDPAIALEHLFAKMVS